jgi:hypothetical protein
MVFATNVVFEPLIGELFRSNLVQQAAAGNGDFVTPTVIGAGEYDYAQRDLRWTQACFGPLVQDREFADHNKQLMQAVAREVGADVPEAAARCSRCGASPTRSRRASRTRWTVPRTGSPESCPTSDSRPRRS